MITLLYVYIYIYIYTGIPLAWNAITQIGKFIYSYIKLCSHKIRAYSNNPNNPNSPTKQSVKLNKSESEKSMNNETSGCFGGNIKFLNFFSTDWLMAYLFVFLFIIGCILIDHAESTYTTLGGQENNNWNSLEVFYFCFCNSITP